MKADPMSRRPFLAASLALATLGLAPSAGAQGTLTLRDRLHIVSSGSAGAISEQLARAFVERHTVAQPPEVAIIGSNRAFQTFCAGMGPDTPDIAITSRRMPRAVQQACLANGVRDIIELQVGLGAVVLAVKRGDVGPALTSQQVWSALAAERPAEDTFIPNQVETWRQLGAGLPRTPIRMIIPSTEDATRALFEDLVLEAGCRHVKEIRLLFEASYRRSKCVTLREDGRLTELPAADIPAALLASPPGTIAVMSYDQMVRSGGNIIPLSLDGVFPSTGTIINLDYEQTRTLFLYAKRQHSRNVQGVGVVRGIRELLAEATSEGAAGPGGYLAALGIVPLAPADRQAQRRIAERQSLMSR